MKTKLIGVLMGGVSSERGISLRSGKNVAAALVSKGYRVQEIDIVSQDCQAQLRNIDVAYNILHGAFGEDGGVQKILEELQIPYTGSGISASQNCLHKVKTKRILEKNSLLTPRYQTLNTLSEVNFLAPCVVKAVSEGSSIGVSIVKNQNELLPVVEKALSVYREIFIEEFISGAEVTVGVLPVNGALTALPILELRPKNEFYDFAAKYTPGGTEFILPAELPPEVAAKTQELARQAYLALNCAGAARVDFVVRERQTPYILEINTNPGMTAQSDLPAAAKAYGLEFPELVEMILLSAAAGKY
ncbi:D-alanine-D-alanine ligase [Candidatus Termititenax aidoneus]|uniref:D-alanine--D-alanine ligase n=1 Tax=Termititenax aidoneus TaxID=2218524 RepID=A0A388T8G3_TERA1|nr:D-alanine-D-alanine ligase [Candidatus Termititenax aidoneus]